MRKIYYLCLAGLVLAGCSSEDFLGEQNVPHTESNEITFISKSEVNTRALEGSNAATALGNEFYVYGVKTIGSSIEQIFTETHYVVKYENNKWDYVGKANEQTIKYWDQGADHYDFFAWAFGSKTPGTATVTHTAASYTNDPVFTVKATNATDLANTYVAAKETRPNNDQTKPMSGQVPLTFKSMGAKVRMAFFEIIPGYRVYITGVYADKDATGANTNNTNFYLVSDAENTGFPSGEVSYTVDYANFSAGSALNTPTPNTEDTNNPKGSWEKTLSFGNAEIYSIPTNGETDPSKAIGTNVVTATTTEGDGKISSTTGSAYTYVYPMPENNLDLNLKITYVLEAEDATEIQEARTAQVVIPHEYAQWKSNYAYSYLFKLTDSELNPITFDVIVEKEEDGIQETVTKIDKDDAYSITTCQPGLVSDAKYNYFVSGKAFEIRVESKDNTSQDLSGDNLKVFHTTTPSVIESSAAPYCISNNQVKEGEAVSYSADKKSANFTPKGVGCYIIRFEYKESSETKYSYKVLNVAQYYIENATDLTKDNTSTIALKLQMNYTGTPVTLTENITFTSSDQTVAVIESSNKVHALSAGTTTISAKIGDTVVATKTITVTE